VKTARQASSGALPEAQHRTTDARLFQPNIAKATISTIKTVLTTATVRYISAGEDSATFMTCLGCLLEDRHLTYKVSGQIKVPSISSKFADSGAASFA
jgi:hypothetical protein